MKRDFSEAARQELLSLVSQVENEKWCDFICEQLKKYDILPIGLEIDGTTLRAGLVN